MATLNSHLSRSDARDDEPCAATRPSSSRSGIPEHNGNPGCAGIESGHRFFTKKDVRERAIRQMWTACGIAVILAVTLTSTGADTRTSIRLHDGEGTVRPDGADMMASEDYIVANVKSASRGAYEPYSYTFIATPDGTSGVVVQGQMGLPQPRIEDDVCPLHTFLKVADGRAAVPPALLASCADDLQLFGHGLVDPRSRDIRVNELRANRAGSVTYGSTPAPYCTGGDGGRNAFITQRWSDI